MSRTILLVLAFLAIVSTVAAHGSKPNSPLSKRDMPYGWRAKRDVQASTCSYMQCAVSGGNCGASGSSLQLYLYQPFSPFSFFPPALCELHFDITLVAKLVNIAVEQHAQQTLL